MVLGKVVCVVFVANLVTVDDPGTEEVAVYFVVVKVSVVLITLVVMLH